MGVSTVLATRQISCKKNNPNVSTSWVSTKYCQAAPFHTRGQKVSSSRCPTWSAGLVHYKAFRLFKIKSSRKFGIFHCRYVRPFVGKTHKSVQPVKKYLQVWWWSSSNVFILARSFLFISRSGAMAALFDVSLQFEADHSRFLLSLQASRWPCQCKSIIKRIEADWRSSG